MRPAQRRTAVIDSFPVNKVLLIDLIYDHVKDHSRCNYAAALAKLYRTLLIVVGSCKKICTLLLLGYFSVVLVSCY